MSERSDAALAEELVARMEAQDEQPIQVVSLETGFVALEDPAPTAEETADIEGIDDAPGEGEEDLEGEAASETGEVAAEGSEEGGSAAASDEEGPEPARIPTSLTATLREQGGRYPHRVSRRTRRKGRGDRGPDGQRAPQGEGRPEGRGIEQGGEQRIVQRPEGRPEGRPDPRPERSESRPDRQDRGDKIPLPSISDLLKEGQEIIVQIAKEPLGQKGARITSHIALPGRFVVYMPTVDHIGVSRKIRQRRRTPAAEAHSADQPPGQFRRLHRAHGGRRPHRRRIARRHDVPLQPLAGHARRRPRRRPRRCCCTTISTWCSAFCATS